MLEYNAIKNLVDAAEKSGKKISELVLEDQAQELEKTPQEVYDKMSKEFDVMQEAVKFGEQKDQRSTSGLTGGEGYKMKAYNTASSGGLSGSLLVRAMGRALAVAGCNASMGRIVAAPTAGSCGILPGCLITMLEDRGLDRHAVVMSLFTAGAFGITIATNASIAGAEGGCQAECGSAAGMAAAAWWNWPGARPKCAPTPAPWPSTTSWGWVCDPVAGLVEIPASNGTLRRGHCLLGRRYGPVRHPIRHSRGRMH